MPDTFTFELVSPERLLISQPVASVLVPGSEGDFQVLPRHAPVLATLRPGLLDVVLDNGEERRIFVRGGFAEVGNDRLTVLAQTAIDLAELDAAQLAQQIADAQEDVTDATTDAARDQAQETLDRLQQLRDALQLS